MRKAPGTAVERSDGGEDTGCAWPGWPGTASSNRPAPGTERHPAPRVEGVGNMEGTMWDLIRRAGGTGASVRTRIRARARVP